MELPVDDKIIEGPIAFHWFTPDGILHSKTKDQALTKEMAKAAIEFYAKLAKGKKLVMISDTTNVHPMDNETKEVFSQGIPKIFKAIAIISNSQMGRIIANIFLKFRKHEVPMRVFLTQHDAAEWARQFL